MPSLNGHYNPLDEDRAKWHEEALKHPESAKVADMVPTYKAPEFKLTVQPNVAHKKTTGTKEGCLAAQDSDKVADGGDANKDAWNDAVSLMKQTGTSDEADANGWKGRVSGLPKGTYTAGATAANKQNLLPVPWSCWNPDEVPAFHKDVTRKNEIQGKVDLGRCKWSDTQVPAKLPASIASYDKSDRIVLCLANVGNDVKATAWAHKLVLYADATRKRGKFGATALKRLRDDASTAHLADMEKGKYRTEVSSYNLDSDIERDMLYLECIPKSARAYLALKHLESKPIFARDGAFLPSDLAAFCAPTAAEKKAKWEKDFASTGGNPTAEQKNYEEAFTHEFTASSSKCDLIHNVWTPTARDRAEWVRDMLLEDYNILFEARVKTHREPLVDTWNSVHNIYGKAGPVSEDGLIQQGHYMRVGNRAGQKENKFNKSLEIFWLSNREPPLGSKSAWIPDAFGGVREVWFSTAKTAEEEEERAFKDSRLPYMLFAEQEKERSWEMWAPKHNDVTANQEIPFPSAVPKAPALTVFQDGEYQASKTFEETKYYPSVGTGQTNNGTQQQTSAVPSTMYNPTIPGSYAAPAAAPVAAAAAPAAAAAESRSDYSDYSDYGGYSDGYSDYSDYGNYSDYSY